MSKLELTKQTKKNKRWYNLFTILSFMAFFGPITFYSAQALFTATLTTQKIALCSTVMIVVILTLVSLVNKTMMRSRIWIIVIALWACLDSFLQPLLIIAITQVVDELILTPLKKYFKARYIINKEIDRRS